MVKLLRKLLRPAILISIIAVAVAFVSPELIPEPAIKDKVVYIRDNPEAVLQNIPVDKDKVLGITSSLKSQRINPREIFDHQSLPEEIVVEDVAKSISEQLSQIPVSQAQKIKMQFCQDIVAQSLATLSANPAL